MIFNIPEFGFFYSILIFLIVVVSVSVHEFTHALIAHLRGDETARLMGRLTLNPVAHFDPVGFLLMLFTNFGWGKPVPIDPYNMKNPKWDNTLVAVFGPISNLALACLSGLILHLLVAVNAPLSNTGEFILEYFVIINVGLAVFNLLPFPPLDGSNIYRPFLPLSWQYKINRFATQYIILIFLLAFLPIFNGESLISFIMTPIISVISGFILYVI